MDWQIEEERKEKGEERSREGDSVFKKDGNFYLKKVFKVVLIKETYSVNIINCKYEELIDN